MQSRDIQGRWTIDGVGRLYEVGENRLPSVSTVLNMRETPEALKRWKERQSNYEAVMSYAQNRGTLVHAECQEDVIPHNPETGKPIKKLWGEDEAESETELKENGEWERFTGELEWVEDSWELIKQILNLPPTPEHQQDESYNTVLDVETYVANTNIGYAGQFDLLYHDIETNETVLGDLKTSKNVYEKHQLQLAAYRMAVPISIDRMEVIRMNPDRKDWEISSSHTWTTPISDLEDEFIELRAKLEEEKLKTIVDTMDDMSKEDEGIMYETMG